MQGKGVTLVRVPVGTKTGLTHPPVIKLPLIGMKFRTSGERLAVYAVIKVVGVAGSVAEAGEALIYVSPAHRDQRSMSVAGAFGDDVDHRIHRIRAPDGAARAPDDFDSIHISEQGVLHVPIDSRK